MQYVLLFGLAAGSEIASQPTEEQAALHEQVMTWWEKHSQAGTIVHGARLQPTTTATTIRGGGADKPVVTDGPFIEAKEVLGGYGLIDVKDLDEALALAKTWPLLALPGQSVEVRPVWEM